MPFTRFGLFQALVLCLACANAQAFCGFYVGKADASLFNQASQVIMVRDGQRTVISMLNDYRGELKEFALVVPVPQVLERGQIHVGDKRLFEHIDAYSAPRLTEYFDEDPCVRRELKMSDAPAAAGALQTDRKEKRDRSLGVTVEATYTVGEYDIVILSAKESNGLETWLLANGYRIPAGASQALRPYVRQQMKFFVARVNLQEQARTGLTHLRPLQFAFESEKFMLPIRLGMINASGPQDLIVYVLTRNGRVEATNYRTLKLPANVDLPLHVRAEFNDFYRSMFERQAQNAGYRAVFTEYFWDMSWCDPCAADPLAQDELRGAGVFWLDPEEPGQVSTLPGARFAERARRAPANLAAPPVMLTRLHVRYTPDTFPEDLSFQETGDRSNFQARYVLRHPWKGSPQACPQARLYFEGVARRQADEAETLASLTGWQLPDIRKRIDPLPVAKRSWWERLWQ
jgi:hypothetical protein